MGFSDFIVTGEWKSRPAQYRYDQIIVSVRDSVPERAIESIILAAVEDFSGAEIISWRSGRRWAVVSVPQGTEAGQMALAVSRHRDVRYAEPDFLLSAHSLSINDADWGSQDWATTIRLKEAWQLIVDTWGRDAGSSDVMLAVFDTGIQINGGVNVDHPDLDPARFIVAHVDSGGVAVSHDEAYGTALPNDKNGHGTEIAGIIAATLNTLGIAGMNWVSQVYVAKVLDDAAKTVASAAKEAMDRFLLYLDTVSSCTRVVVNMSFGTTDSTEAESLKDMLATLDSSRFLVCCAPAFHDESSTGRAEYHADYPARYAATMNNVVSVGESDNDDKMVRPFDWYNMGDIKEVTVVAPGDAAYTTLLQDPAAASPVSYGATTGGTSFACPMAAALASLVWAQSPWLTPDQVKQYLIDTGVLITSGGENYYRIDAAAALLKVHADIELKTPFLSFVDVPVGESATLDLGLTVTCTDKITFCVVADGALDAAFTIEGDKMYYTPGASSAVSGARVRYIAGAAGTSVSGKLKIQVECSCMEWEVTLTGNAAAATASAIALVADTSGSMASPSGILTRTRMEILTASLGTAIDTMLAGSACGLVRFDSDAHLEKALVEIDSTDLTDPGRESLRSGVTGLLPGGNTSIGDGVKLGNDTAVVDITRAPGILVLTDGHENEEESIDDVMDEITCPVYAIGMGTAAMLRPESLEQLASATGGYLLLTDTLDVDNQNCVAKYVLQMLAELVGDTVLLDPRGRLLAGQVIEIPFPVTAQDTRCDVLVLAPAKNVVSIELVMPSGRRIRSGTRRSGIEFEAGDHVSFYRLDTGGRLAAESPGRWRALLSVEDRQLAAYVKSLPRKHHARTRAHGVPFDLMVVARSSLTMRARSHANGHAPGSRVTLRAILRDGGQPLRKSATVTASIRMPDGAQMDLQMGNSGTGTYEYAFRPGLPGVYTSRIHATGYNVRGEYFTRENAVTTHMWAETRAARRNVARAPARHR